MTGEKEYRPAHELRPELVNAFAQTFISRTDCYPMQLENGAYISVQKPLTHHKLIDHLNGKVTLGAYALDSQSYARWLCLDADDEDTWAAMRQSAHDLEAEGIFAYLELSRRGGHCWLFTSPLPGATIRQFGKALLAQYKLPSIELYPKQDILRTGTGSLVRLPFGIHRKTGKRYHFISPDGQPLAPSIRQQIALLSTPALVPQAFIETTLQATPIPSPPPPTVVFARTEYVQGETLSQRLKNAISVYEFVNRFVPLDERGKGLCPFHADQVQSFQVNREANYWSCYAGCGGGSIIDFWMRWRAKQGQDSSFTTTITDLARLFL
jgi:hypothetical protein